MNEIAFDALLLGIAFVLGVVVTCLVGLALLDHLIDHRLPPRR